jgi:hypothetical protein
MATKQIIRRKEIRKEYIVSLRRTEKDYYDYEQRAIDEQIRLADFLRQAIEKGVKKRIKELVSHKKG